MTYMVQTVTKSAGKIWITIRFIVFGVGGFLAVLFSWMFLVLGVVDPTIERWHSLHVAAPLGVVGSLAGALMILFGVGQWGRWAYLWVFVSVPLAISPLGMLASRYPRFDSLFAKPVLLVLIVLPMPVSYLLVREYYQRRESKGNQGFQMMIPKSIFVSETPK